MTSDIYVVGANSQLGQALRKIRPEWIYLTRADLDLTDLGAYDKVFGRRVPVIINFASFTAVDDAEKKAEEAQILNSQAPGELAKRCETLLQISTDYVYSGRKTTPYVETDETGPLSVYGQTKLQGEQSAHKNNPRTIIIRTSWLYSAYNKNFVKRMLELAQIRDHLRIVDDQIGTPTYADDLVEVVSLMAVNPDRYASEIYHYSNLGQCSWYEFTKEIFRLKNIHTPVQAIKTVDYPLPATRPAYSVLDKNKIMSTAPIKIPTWQSSLARFLGHTLTP